MFFYSILNAYSFSKVYLKEMLQYRKSSKPEVVGGSGKLKFMTMICLVSFFSS